MASETLLDHVQRPAKITVSIHSCPRVHASLLNHCTGYIYRYTATGTPTTGVHRYYEIANELGKGTFATVMKAVNRKTGENVAIKMIHRQLKKKLQHASEAGESTFDGSNDGDATASTKAFRREIAIMEQLDHPNVWYVLLLLYTAGDLQLR